MTRRTLVTRTLVAAIVAFVLYSLIMPPHYSWRQKLTVTVSTPQGPVEGSAVTQVDIYDLRRFSFGFPDASGTNSSFTGEAVAVEIAPGKVLFVLLANERSQNQPTDWPDRIWYKLPMTLQDYMARIKDQRGKPPEPMPQEHWPLMATFDDMSRPETLHLIKGTDLSYWFGLGVKVDGVTLQITREPITEGRIETLLPWLLPAGFERGPVAEPPVPFLSLSAFLSKDHWSKK
jgi:hypothetical protein